MQKEDKEDVMRFGQNVHTTQTFSKKKTLKSSYASLGGSITKLLTMRFRSDAQRRLTEGACYV